MFGDITVKSRPLRLAFFIAPDKASLLKAVQINSTLWGGALNPIIPLYARAPATWKEYPGQKITIKDRVLGYVRAFDPDILVNCTNADLPAYLLDTRRPIISIDDIWRDFLAGDRSDGPKYGVGIFELLNGLYKEFFEVQRRFPTKVVLPTFPREHALFWAAAFGQFPDPIQEIIEAEYSAAIDIEKPALTPENYEATVKANTFFPRRITRYHLETERTGRRLDEASGFYMDATKLQDIIDFWNLRALGRSAIPIPKQFVHIPEFIQFIQNYVRSEFGVSRHNPAVTFGTRIIRSSSSKMSELEALAGALDLGNLIPGNPNAHPLSLQHWYPRIWDEWAMDRDGAKPANVFSQVEELSFPEADGTVTFNLLKPDFVSDRYIGTPRYANEIYPKFYDYGDTGLAEVLPYDHGTEVLRVAGGMAALPDEFRIGRTGLIHLVKWKGRAHWKVPLGEDVFFAWLKDKGFDAELSSCGRLAKQVHSQLKGWVSALTHEPMLALFEKMNKGGEDGKGVALGEVKNSLKKIDERGRFYQSLVERGVFQLGYKTQCTHCERSSWHSLDELSAQLVCPLCHKKLDAIHAVDSSNHGNWHLKTAGPFSVGNYADGSYSVLLGLNCLERDRSLQTTPIMSFKAKHRSSGRELEADFALLWQETVYGETQDGVLFAECKSYNKFKREDFDRMTALAKQFPGAILAFCTLRQTLDADEKRALMRIAKAGTKRWKSERPINPVLILTGRELFGYARPPHCWPDDAVPAWTKNAHTLLEVCNATQSIYLGLPRWQDVWHAEFEKRRKGKGGGA